MLSFGPRALRVQLRVVMAVLGEQPGTGAASVQTTPVPVGRGSLIFTPYAVPGPPFVVVTVKPIGSPLLTVAESACFLVPTEGCSTVMVAVAVLSVMLVPVSFAVLGRVPGVEL